VLGFCLGGGFALMVANRGQFAACAPNYAVLTKDLDAALDGACPVVASYGSRDGLRLLRPLLKLNGAGPRPDAAADAWLRIETFFHYHLD
jgi:carboxymethylenebutenolidase